MTQNIIYELGVGQEKSQIIGKGGGIRLHFRSNRVLSSAKKYKIPYFAVKWCDFHQDSLVCLGCLNLGVFLVVFENRTNFLRLVFWESFRSKMLSIYYRQFQVSQSSRY